MKEPKDIKPKYIRKESKKEPRKEKRKSFIYESFVRGKKAIPTYIIF